MEFTVTNTSTTKVSLGCGIPWTLQQRTNGRWREVIWTASDGVPHCLTRLPPGKSFTEEVTLTRSAIETQNGTVKYDLTAGLDRFVLIGTDPFVATDFRFQLAQ
ncbi:immunoglobulin-like domain-containing protein [Haladaptatus halobius]|uniref:immunoglobulin-like domain-containing protein n=1 Tax=Haladaptatus halobius TaxID=2884875 RepID=UPI0034A24049